MKYFLIFFISLFIFGCSTTSTYTQEKADAITDMERCFGINTGVHYWDLKKLDEDGHAKLVESLNRLHPKREYPIQEICGSEYYLTLTNRRIAEAKAIEESRAQALRNFGLALQGLSTESNNQNQTNSNNNQGYKPLRGTATRQYYNDMGKLVCSYADGYTITSSSTRCPYNP